jgi:hypothetical protein
VCLALIRLEPQRESLHGRDHKEQNKYSHQNTNLNAN